MSPFSALGIASKLFDLLQSTSSKTTSATNLADGTDFSTSLKVRLAELQANSITTITSGAANASSTSSPHGNRLHIHHFVESRAVT